MRFKQFLESKSNNLWVVTDKLEAWESVPPGEFYVSHSTVLETGYVLKEIEVDEVRELVYFKLVYFDDDISNSTWYTNLRYFRERTIAKSEYDRNFLNSLKEAVDVNSLSIGSHVFVVKTPLVGKELYTGSELSLWFGDELEFMGFNPDGSILVYASDDEDEDETIELIFDESDFKKSVVTEEDWKRIKRARDAKFLRGLKENLDLSKLKVGMKLKVDKPFSARETELRQAVSFKSGEELEFAGSKPWKNGKIIYFFGKKDQYNTHYMFEVPEQLFYRSVILNQTPVKESESEDEVEIGQTRIVIGEIIGVTPSGLIPLDSGTIKIVDIHPKRAIDWVDWKKKDPSVVFTHSDYGNARFEYMMSEIEKHTSTPEGKKRRDRIFLKSLKEAERFKVGDSVWFTKNVEAIFYNSDKLTTANKDLRYVFFGYEDGFANVGPRWRRKPTFQVMVDDFEKYAMNEREYGLKFLKGLKESVEFKKGDKVFFRNRIVRFTIDDVFYPTISPVRQTFSRLNDDMAYYFVKDFGECVQISTHVDRMNPGDGWIVRKKDFEENAMTEHGKNLDFLKNLKAEEDKED